MEGGEDLVGFFFMFVVDELVGGEGYEDYVDEEDYCWGELEVDGGELGGVGLGFG